ncbi:MAG: beta-ketoacyl-ACP synthase II [Planctomycetes bacterium]|nr:beta-ketoacyl-ACP synthase II [Planctomycetota bacterium]
MSKRRVVITGLGTVNPLGNSVPAFWEGMLAGRSGVTRVTKLDASQYDSQIAGEVKDFPGIPEAYVSKREARRLDPFAEYAVAAAVEAVIDSGLDFQKEDRLKCGVVVGSGIGGLQELETQHERLMAKGPSKVSAFTIPKLMVNAAAGNISILWQLQGPSVATVTACASAGHAMADALRYVQSGMCDIVLTGGSEAAVTKIGLASFCALKGLSTRNDDPATASRPWDEGRDGFVMADGAGIVVLEEFEHARARGAAIYGELLGAGSSGDGYHITAPQPDGAGAALAMQRALKDAGIEPGQVGYINAHGTSTQLGDIAETKAVKAVFGDHAYKGLMISSTKSFIGHSLGASGGIEMVAVAKAIREGVIPQTLNLQTPGQECDLDYVPREPRAAKVNVAMSNSFGFGGHNISLVVRRFAD